MCKKADQEKNKGLTTPSDIQRFDNISYGKDEKWNVLDIYRPKKKKGNLPVIINVHGGGWVYGNKELYQFYCMYLAQQGFAVVNFTYRIAPKFRFPAALEDLNEVVEFIRVHAKQYGVDCHEVYMAGDSAGANLACLYTLLLTNDEYASKFELFLPVDFKIRALLLNCGIYDIYAYRKEKGNMVYMTEHLLHDLFGTRKLVEEQLDKINPVKYITDKFPPCYIMTATGDFLKNQPKYLIDKLKENEISYEYKIYGTEENPLGHVFHCDFRLEEAKMCNDQEIDFLKKISRERKQDVE